MSEKDSKQKRELAERIEQYCAEDGSVQTAIPNLSFGRQSEVSGLNYGVYTTSLCFIAQGSKEVLLGKDRFIYSPKDYLIASVDLPASVRVREASSEVPYLSLKIEFTPNDILEVLQEEPFEEYKKEKAKIGMKVNTIEPPLLDALNRYVHLLDSPEDIPVLAPLITKEIIYRVLQGRQAESLKQVAIEGSTTYQINQAVTYIMKSYAKNFKIEELAEIANMSVSTFYRAFKEVTTMTPIQFQKQIRLQEARNLLLMDSLDVADIAFQVGYESPSQFSREYARMYGLSPKKDRDRLERV